MANRPNAKDQLIMMFRSIDKGERLDLLSATKLKTYLSLEKLGLMYADSEDGLIWMTDAGKYLLSQVEVQVEKIFNNMKGLG